MKKYDVLAYKRIVVGKGEEKEDGVITIEINNIEYILEECNNKDSLIQTISSSLPSSSSSVSKKVEKTKDSSILVNDITKKVRKSYSIEFKKPVIRELSHLLNDSYHTAYSSKGLRKAFKPIIEKHYGKSTKARLFPHILYFVIEGRLKKSEPGFYEVIKSNLIPKQKNKDENLGILDELDMS